MIGHQTQLDRLRKAAASDQLANAYLFTGPEGIGKKLVAFQFASELLASEKVFNSTHPDVQFITVLEDKKDISIEQLREMSAGVQMHPMEGRYKIVIIDNAERMNASAANSVLKILEEPPRATHFFLITSRPHMLLPTILSRCQKIAFSPPPISDIIGLIERSAGIDRASAELLAHITCGSIGQAITFPAETLKNVVTAIQKVWEFKKPADILATAEVWGKKETDHKAVLAIILAVYHDIASYQAIKKAPVFASLASQIISIAEKTSQSSIQRKVSAIISTERDLEATYNKQLMFEQLLFVLTS